MNTFFMLDSGSIRRFSVLGGLWLLAFSLGVGLLILLWRRRRLGLSARSLMAAFALWLSCAVFILMLILWIALPVREIRVQLAAIEGVEQFLRGDRLDAPCHNMTGGDDLPESLREKGLLQAPQRVEFAEHMMVFYRLNLYTGTNLMYHCGVREEWQGRSGLASFVTPRFRLDFLQIVDSPRDAP